MANINRVVLVGNLTKDPELRPQLLGAQIGLRLRRRGLELRCRRAAPEEQAGKPEAGQEQR